MFKHLPVLEEEVILGLAIKPAGFYVDATLGLGGHSERIKALLNKPNQLLGIDQDEEALKRAKELLGTEPLFYRANFDQLTEVLADAGHPKVDGILMDIGVSSMQLDDASRGFSFMQEGALDMRMDQRLPLTAAEIVNTWSERDLARIIWEYGEERLSRKIAKYICERRLKEPFNTTTDLAETIISCFHPAARHKKPHPATRTFQALRIVVNDELGVLERGIAQALKALAPGGRLAVVTFHSLEDRIVKHAFVAAVAGEGFGLVNKKPIIPTEEEQKENSRSRSAKLRIIEALVED